MALGLLACVMTGCAGDPDDDPSDFPDGPREWVWSDGKDDSAAHNIPYLGGRVLHAPREVHIYWGSYWNGTAGRADRKILDGFAARAGASSWYGVLAQYRDGQGPPGRSLAAPPVVVTSPAPGATVTDKAIRAFIRAQIDAGVLPADGDDVYFVFPPPGTVVYSPWGKSCGAICGYHYRFDGVLYAVIPYLDCAECGVKGVQVNSVSIDEMTVTLSHELAEAVTDPYLDAWTTSRGKNEVGDLCDGGFAAQWGTEAYAVQNLWSNAISRCTH